MKKLFYTFLFIVILLPATAQESGIRFFQGTWEEAVALARKEKKKIFADVFTEWCGPCLNMALTVFPLPEVGEVYNKSFVCIKIDAEKGEGRELAERYRVHSYPSYLFIEPKKQELIHRNGGNKPVADFIADSKGALNPKLSSVYLTEKYKSGKYDAAFLIDYIRNQKISGNREVQKDFSKLIDMGCKLTDPEVWQLFCDCIKDARSPYIKEVSDNYKQFTELFGKEAVDEQLTEATVYAPESLLQSLCDFDGKEYNLMISRLSRLFRENNNTEAWKMVDQLMADTTIDQQKFVKNLSFYVRVNPKYQDNESSFEELVRKMHYLRYVTYNMYNREDAYVHYSYALGLEYLIQRSVREGKQIPADLFQVPEYGKKEYELRHPLLKPKPKR